MTIKELLGEFDPHLDRHCLIETQFSTRPFGYCIYSDSEQSSSSSCSRIPILPLISSKERFALHRIFDRHRASETGLLIQSSFEQFT